MNDERNLGEKTDDSGQQPRYEHYQFHEEQGTVLKPSGPSGHRRNQNSFQKKAGATIALAVIFGLVAAVVFQAANFAADRFLNTGKSSVQIKTTDSVDLQETASDDSTADKVLSDSENGTVAAVAQASMPSVVAITTVSVQEIPSFFGYSSHQYKSASTGSGIIVGDNDDELLIATNNHVVDGATTLSVCFIGDDVANAETETVNAGDNGDLNVEDAVSAKIKGTDADNDLAVVAVQKADIPEDTLNQIKIAQIGSSDDLVVGQQVVAIGNALGYGQSVTSGWISALNRTISTDDGTNSTGLIQTDAAINPGNSGGALLNMKGELIGINSAKYADSAVEGMGYAIPISKAKPILEELMNRETREKVDSSKKGYLGVSLASLTTEAIEMYNMPTGAFVRSVEDDSPAQEAGICKGDIIVKFDGQKVSDGDDLLDKLFYNYQTVAIMLILFGVAFIVIENYHKGKKAKVNTLVGIDYKLAFWIGMFQLIAAIFPGTSRSGATIVGALLLGISRTVAAEYTFFLAIPVMFGASLLKGAKFLMNATMTSQEGVILVVGMVVAFAVSLVVIKFLMGYIKKHDFKVFGWYRIILGVIVLLCGFAGFIG